MGTRRRRRADRAGRPPMRSPGRPPVGRREHRQRFWNAVGRGLSSEEAGVSAGVSPAVGVRWFRESGGMAPLSCLAPLSGRYLSFAERAEYVVEGAGELRIPIANKEIHPASSFLEDKQQVAGLLGDPSRIRVGGHPGEVDSPSVQLDEEQAHTARSQMVSTVKKSQATIPAACWRRNACQVVEARRGAGSSPWRRSVVRIAVAETCMPSCWSSPWMRW
jgi:hypothetical protein